MTVLSMVPNDTPLLPAKVIDVPKDVLRNFPHSKKVGNYLLGNTLGEGSFAKVKEALHIPTGERVAVKIIDKKKSREDSYVRKNLRREGKILQMVRHSNIVQLLEIMETQNSYYLVTELCRGGDLMDYISQRRKLPEPEVKKYIRQIVSAVDYLHRLGILHRDLKIENLLMDEFKDMKIIDFGLSNCVKLVPTKDGPRIQDYCVTQCGSPAYAAPELLGRRKYGPQVDIWSIGVNMYAMLTGNLPFTVEPFNIKILHQKMITGQMNPLPDGTTRDCRDLIKKLLNPDPDRRITMEEVLRHAWIAEGPGCPLPRAHCPNKMKTDDIDNSIIRHMSDNQGFRIGEVIRYVTGNVPSSATAMYYLINRKLQKHYGHLRASGKIAADNRLAAGNRNSTRNYHLLESRPCTSLQRKTPVPAASNVVTSPSGSPIRTPVTSPVKVRDTVGSQIEAESTGGSSKDTECEKSDAADDAFSDIMQTKGTNDIFKIPRVQSPIKKPKNDEVVDNQPVDAELNQTVLPKVANKNMTNGLNSATSNSLKPALAASETVEINETDVHLDTSLQHKPGKSSATNAVNESDEPFRPRASTFPGKVQRPNVKVEKTLPHTITIDSGENKTVTSPRSRLYRPHRENIGSSPIPVNENPLDFAIGETEGFADF
ncbi:hormonally up-regulated neu tumor-associated kinase homolog A-like [Dreissena polymorpha]|uniref:hormonally up-regulated neu tumor-associated kinase homolog A-like n=1 Tax=Dreissena polymorpha TaxID=45954 RepID=UPI0022652C50|nr:hormonally up-regulated neu tumor-associated kinase homolog A-like [Dreissena polymorpha]